MPLQQLSWADMMEAVEAAALKVRNETRASWNFRHVYFLNSMLEERQPGIPANLHILQHVFRSPNLTKPGQFVKAEKESNEATKEQAKNLRAICISEAKKLFFAFFTICSWMFPYQSFHNPAKVLFLHNHLPLGCLSGHCTSYPVHPALARLHHYRHRHHHCVGAHQVGQGDGVSGRLVVTGLMTIPSCPGRLRAGVPGGHCEGHGGLALERGAPAESQPQPRNPRARTVLVGFPTMYS